MAFQRVIPGSLNSNSTSAVMTRIDDAEYLFEFWKAVQEEHEKTMAQARSRVLADIYVYKPAKFNSSPSTRRQLKVSRIGSWSKGQVGLWSSDDYDWDYSDEPLPKKGSRTAGGPKLFSDEIHNALVQMMQNAPNRYGKDVRYTYPSEEAKHYIMDKHGLTERQVNDFASNYRRRVQKKSNKHKH